MIVLGVSDGDRVVHRCAQAPERFLEPAGLADAVRQHHEPAEIEGDSERETETADDLDDVRCSVSGSLDHALTTLMSDPAPSELSEKSGIRPLAERDGRW